MSSASLARNMVSDRCRMPDAAEKVCRPACKPGPVPHGAATIISLGRRLPGGSSDLPEGRNGPDQPCPLIWSCSRWGLPSQLVTKLLVGPYIKERMFPHHFTLTLSPSEPRTQRSGVSGSDGDKAVYFLLHFPCPSFALPMTKGELGRWLLTTTASCGARTFLSPLAQTATVQPTRGLSLL